jgi:serine protease inhibitor
MHPLYAIHRFKKTRLNICNTLLKRHSCRVLFNLQWHQNHFLVCIINSIWVNTNYTLKINQLLLAKRQYM